MKESTEQETDFLSPSEAASLKQLELLVFQMTEIYQRLRYDRDRWSVVSVTFTEGVETFRQHIQQEALLNKNHRDQLTQGVQEESRQILKTLAVSVQQTTQQVLTDQITTTIDPLKTTVQQAQQVFLQYQRQAATQVWRVLLIALSSAVIGSVLGGMVFPYFLK